MDTSDAHFCKLLENYIVRFQVVLRSQVVAILATLNFLVVPCRGHTCCGRGGAMKDNMLRFGDQRDNPAARPTAQIDSQLEGM